MNAIITYTNVEMRPDDSFFLVYLVNTRYGEVTDQAFDDFADAWAYANKNSKKIVIDPSVPEALRAEVAA